jgi:hypothetical protein
LLIRGKSRELVKETLEHYCAEAGYNGTTRLFVLTNRGFGFAVAGLLRNPFLSLQLLNRLRAGKITALKLPLPAATFRVKNNIRVFFNVTKNASKPITAKVAIQSRNRTGSLMQEIDARRRLADKAMGRFAIPRVIRYDTAKFSWMEEEFIEARLSITTSDKVDVFLNEAAVPIYSDFRRPQYVTEIFPKVGIESGDILPLFGELDVGQELLERRWTASFIHGNLSPANMMFGTDDRLYVIDWELSYFAPVAWDLKKLFPHDKKKVLDVIRTLRHEDDMQSNQQMQIAFLCELAFLRKNGGLRFSYLTSNRSKSNRVAREMIASHDKKLVSFIRELAQT